MTTQDMAPDATSAPLERRSTKPARRLPGDNPAQLTLAEAYAFERNALPDEVRRYLAAVDTFRAEGSAPSWRPEVQR